MSDDLESETAPEPPEDADPPVDRDRSVRLVVSGYATLVWIGAIVDWRWQHPGGVQAVVTGALFCLGWVAWMAFNGMSWSHEAVFPLMREHCRALGWPVWPGTLAGWIAHIALVAALNDSLPR